MRSDKLCKLCDLGSRIGETQIYKTKGSLRNTDFKKSAHIRNIYKRIR